MYPKCKIFIAHYNKLDSMFIVAQEMLLFKQEIWPTYMLKKCYSNKMSHSLLAIDAEPCGPPS